MGWPEMTNLALGAATSSGAFGEVVDYRPAGDAAVSYQIRGIVEDDHQEVVLEGETTVSRLDPSVSVQLSAMQTEPQEDDELVVRGKRYAVVDVQLDGQGSADLILNWLEGDT
jgi:hypothetical protein